MGAGAAVARLRVVVVVGAALAAPAVLAGCAVPPTPDAAATERPCSAPGEAVELAPLAFDATPETFVTLGGGHYRITADGFRHDGPFDPPTGRTQVVWGPRGTVPTYDPGAATVTGTSGSVGVVEGSPVVVELPGGTWWFLNSSFVGLTLEPCAGATAERVDAQP